MKQIIKITNNAWKKIYDITLKSNNNKFLFGVTSGGCNGFNFNLKLMEHEDLKEIKNMKPNYLENNDVKVFIDPFSEMHLIGTEIDYVREVFGSHFEIKNPSASSSCGCGESFGV